MSRQLPLPLMPAIPPVRREEISDEVNARFWTHVVRTPACWFWVGAIAADGYGTFNYARADGSRRTLGTHRAAFEIAHPELEVYPDVLMHGCNERSCVRVEIGHVLGGTSALNNRYAVATGRHRGPRPGMNDPRGARARSVAIRDALRTGYDPVRLAIAMTVRDPGPVLF
ncbi:hypothetical protein CLV47_12354 [Antricoccus suffuscus]|uniref:HNH endonuclease n=1 Tax=Antricoccus suffuscus TaxID=1629062 RepID=A0A2T0ZEP3_9ACTN|nr:hypothetical protein [Antricoccus suffuscus]PRZ34822.1 hypothetical protein CLV47_12354 [Antricoccus suffuscus]